VDGFSMGRQVSKRFKKEKAKAAAKRQKGEAATKWQHALTAAIGVCEWDDADGGELIGALMQLPEAVKMLLLQGEAEVDMERVVAAIMRCHANKDAEVVHN
jgi:uncharacterized membrane protein YqiK|tara:strand:- start:2096 stop:2398 length:303 start_codon:yes stop_codon:yes gene_type:complete